MKEINIGSKVGPVHDPPEALTTGTFRKKNKKRLLPDVFYLRWELELLSAFIAILLLVELPDWASSTTHLFLTKYDVLINVEWLITTANMLIIGFTVYIIFRMAWLYFIRKERELSAGRLSLIGTIDEVAELIITICMIALVTMLFVFLMHLLIILLQNEMLNKMGDTFRVKP